MVRHLFGDECQLIAFTPWHRTIGHHIRLAVAGVVVGIEAGGHVPMTLEDFTQDRIIWLLGYGALAACVI